MILLIFLRLLIFLVPAWFLTTQLILPLVRNAPLFPMFTKKPQLVKAAEERLLEAQAAKQAAEIEQEAARLNKEAWSLNENLYSETIDNDD